METLFTDLHMHSCLSPCGSDDMTPANLCGMAALKGLNMIALTDHNTGLNLPAAKACCDAYGLTLIPGMEITTREEVHLLGYFPDVDTSVAFGQEVTAQLPKKKNKPSLFGNQLIMNEDDEVIQELDALLIGATDLTLAQWVQRIREAGGVAVPAHAAGRQGCAALLRCTLSRGYPGSRGQHSASGKQRARLSGLSSDAACARLKNIP